MNEEGGGYAGGRTDGFEAERGEIQEYHPDSWSTDRWHHTVSLRKSEKSGLEVEWTCDINFEFRCI